MISCICYAVSMEELKALAKEKNCTTVEELQGHIDFGMSCEMCIDYVQAMLDTGETDYEKLNSYRERKDEKE